MSGILLSLFSGAPPTFAVSPSTASVNEGSSVTFTVTTTNVSDGTTLYWSLNTVSGTVNTSDFTGAAVTGSFSISSNTGSVALTLANDTTTEGSESFQLQVRTGSTSGTIVATSSTVTIGDTSLSPEPLSTSNFSTLILPPTGTHSRNSTARPDPNASYLILNIPFWGPNGNTSTSEGIADIHATVKGSGTNLTLTNNSGLSVSTSQYKYYGASANFNYSSLDTPALSGLNGAMTFECWWRHGGGSPGFGDQSGTIWNSNPGGGYSGPGMSYSKGGSFSMSGCDIDSTVFNPSVGTWYHLAFARTGTGGGHTSRFFVNGVLYRYGTNDTQNHSTVWRFGISNGGYTYGSIGYMQDVRVYSGLCKYTSDFTITGP